MKKVLVVAMLLCASPSHAQIVCTIPCPTIDAGAIAKHGLVEEAQKTINEVIKLQNMAVFTMNRRLPTWTPIQHYGMTDAQTPSSKIFDWFSPQVLFAKLMHKTLSYGQDPQGAGLKSMSIPRQPSTFMGPVLPLDLKEQQAMIDLSDGVLTRAADASGTWRLASRDEAAAIVTSQTDTLNETDDQGLNAVAGKMTGQALIDARNAQSQIMLSGAMVELVMLDNKRYRDAKSSLLNFQLNALSDHGVIINTLTKGAGPLLQRWSLP